MATVTKAVPAHDASVGTTTKLNMPVQQCDILHAVDGRTGRYYSIPIEKNAISALDLKKITSKLDVKHPAYQNEQGLRVYDAGFANTVVSESKITYM